MNTTGYQTYPNARGHARGDENRGGLRVGVVTVNKDTERAGTAGYPAMVTHESDGWVKFYTFVPVEDIPQWRGPFDGLSEEIEEMNHETR